MIHWYIALGYFYMCIGNKWTRSNRVCKRLLRVYSSTISSPYMCHSNWGLNLIKLNLYLLQQFHTFSAKKYRDKFKVWDIFQVIWLNFIRKKSWSQKTQILMKPPLYGNMKSERWRFITFQQTIDENDAPLWYKVKCS